MSVECKAQSDARKRREMPNCKAWRPPRMLLDTAGLRPAGQPGNSLEGDSCPSSIASLVVSSSPASAASPPSLDSVSLAAAAPPPPTLMALLQALSPSLAPSTALAPPRSSSSLSPLRPSLRRSSLTSPSRSPAAAPVRAFPTSRTARRRSAAPTSSPRRSWTPTLPPSLRTTPSPSSAWARS